MLDLSIQRLLLIVVVVIGAAVFCAAQTGPPIVSNVEPPNWWVGHSINPVRVMIRGRNLKGAQVTAAGGLQVTGVKTNAPGTYLFADIRITASAKPGIRTLKITTPAGATEAEFAVRQPLSRQGNFQGFSPADVLYLLMPDRFSDGDPTNNEPTQSRGIYDRQNKFYYHGGDLQGVIDHLPYLKDLGVTAVWLTPWYDNYDHPNQIELKDGRPSTGSTVTTRRISTPSKNTSALSGNYRNW